MMVPAMRSRFDALQPLFKAILQSTRYDERSDNPVAEAPEGAFPFTDVRPDQRTATSISRLPGGPGRLPVRKPTASRLRRTDPLAE